MCVCFFLIQHVVKVEEEEEATDMDVTYQDQHQQQVYTVLEDQPAQQMVKVEDAGGEVHYITLNEGDQYLIEEQTGDNVNVMYEVVDDNYYVDNNQIPMVSEEEVHLR